jgi:pimeloyl-ACP methyl ester carboxylesterase
MNKQVNYHYLKKGSPCFVFLHGWGGDLSVWGFMEQAVLAKGYSFLSIDLRGHGYSARLKKPTTLKQYAQDVMDIFNEIKLNQVILVGHCFGGMVAQETALRYPNRIKKLILICSNFHLPFWAVLGNIFLPLLNLVKLGPKPGHRDFSKYRGSHDISFRRLLSDIYHAGNYSYIRIYKGIKKWNKEYDLKQIKKPVLIIAGKKDIIFPPGEQKKFASLFPKAKLVYLNTNHLAPINNPEEVRELILKSGN